MICLLSMESIYGQKRINVEDVKGSLIDYKDYQIKDSRLDDFVGTWELELGDNTLVLELVKKENYNLLDDLKIDVTLDIIQARYLIKNSNTQNENWESDLFIKFGREEGKRTLSFNVVDDYSGLIYATRFILDKKNPNRAQIKFGQTEALTILAENGQVKDRSSGVKFKEGIANLNGKVLRRVR